MFEANGIAILELVVGNIFVFVRNNFVSYVYFFFYEVKSFQEVQ